MKKGISISLVVLMFSAMSHLTVATHYCSGKETGSRVSLTAKLADCGMEGSEKKLPLSGTFFSKHCCEDIVIYCGTSSNYAPTYPFVPETFQNNFQVFATLVSLSVNSYTDLIPLYTYVSPPGALMSTNVDLSDICVFRI